MTTKFRQLINPHSHTDYSLDGAATVKQIIARNAELGATHVAATEHGNMNSAMELYTATKSKGVKPILGIEAYLVNPFVEDYYKAYSEAYRAGKLKLKAKQPDKVETELRNKAMHASYLHVTVHFKDYVAYQYFCKLSVPMWTRALKKYDELKPMITMDELRGISGHITITSSCLKGPVQNFLLPSRDGIIQPSPERAEQMYLMLREIAGPENFYVEVFPHQVTHEWQRPEVDYATSRIVKPGFFKPNECTCHAPNGDLQKLPNQFVLRMAEKYGDKPLISLDSHFAVPDQKLLQNARLGNGQEAWQFYESYHILSTQEAAERLKATLGVDDRTIEEWVDNSYHWASQFNDFKMPTSKDRWILEDTSAAFMERLQGTIAKYGRMDWSNTAMVERLQLEIKTLAHNGTLNLLSYFSLVEDIANFCRDSGVLINVRGSAGGSLLLYLIGVSAVNPLKYNLSFGRFFTEGRAKAGTLPDADLDLSDREAVISYLEQKYGDRVCRLSTDILLKIKSSIKDAERAILGAVRPETEKLCGKLPTTPQGVDDYKFVFGYEDDTGVHQPGLFDTSPELQQYAQQNPAIWETVHEMLGIQRQKSTHACGVIITDKPITDYMPIIRVAEQWATAFSPKSLEAAGGVKLDLLGLNTLRDIQLCLQHIHSRHGVQLNPWDLPHSEQVFDEFAKGNTVGVFQFDTPTVRPYLVATKPRSIEGLSAITALARPGTLDAPSGEDDLTLAQLYVERAQNLRPIKYIHSDLAPILGETMGIALYQEQTMQIYRDIAGFTDEETDTVRRGIGKKDKEVLASSTVRLRQACLARGWTDEQVNLLVEQIMASARYSFNKSHSCSYAQVAYACMWLKLHYPLEFWTAILSNASKDEVATKFWRYTQDFTTLPDINLSEASYRIDGTRIISPLSILSGIGEKTYEALVAGKPYKSLAHFVETHFAKSTKKAAGTTTKSPVHSGVVRKLIIAGALDSLFPPDATILDKLTEFEKIKAEVKDTTKVDAVPEEFIGITDLGRYLIKKQVVSIYSEDLRGLMLPPRGGRLVPSRANPDMQFWMTQNDIPVLDGNQIQWLKDMKPEQFEVMTGYLENSMPYGVRLSPDGGRNYYVSGIGYVIEEKPFPYRNKTKRATRCVIDVNGCFAEDMLWPPHNSDTAASGFKGLPCLVIYRISNKGVSISNITPLLQKTDLDRANVI